MGSCSSKRITPIAESGTRVGQGESSLRSSLKSSSTIICGKSVKWGCITSDEGSTAMILSRFDTDKEEDDDDSDSDNEFNCHWEGYQRRNTLAYHTKVEVPDDFQLISDALSDDLSNASNDQYMNRRTTV